MWSFAPFAVDVVARRPTYTCPNPPFPSFLSTMYVGDPPTCVCVVRWFFRKKKRRITKVRERVRSSDFKRHSSRRNSFKARLWTMNDENTHAIRFVSSFYHQKRKNDDDALKVELPSPELARSRRRRRPPRSRDRCPSFFVRRPLLYFEMSRRIRRLSDDFPTTRSFARRGENEKGERERVSQFGSAVARRRLLGCCCRRREERRQKVTKTEREREKVSSSWEEKKYGEKKCRSRGGQTISKNAHELHTRILIYTICWIHTVEENVFRTTTTTTTTTTLQNAHHDEEEEEKALKSVIAPPQTWTTTHPASFVSFVASRTRPS